MLPSLLLLSFFTSFPLCPISKTWWTHWYCSLRKETSNKKIIFNDELILKHPGRFALGFPYIISSFCFLEVNSTYTKLFSHLHALRHLSFLYTSFLLRVADSSIFMFFFSFFFPLITLICPFLPLACGRKPPKIRANKF